MSTFQKEYLLNKVKQLIDLNGDSVNFRIKFAVKSKNGEPFELTVADQTTLDNNNLVYEKVTNGQRSGEVFQDKNVYQNFFLVLKSEQPCQVMVNFVKEELPKTSTKPAQLVPAQPAPPEKQDGFGWVKLLLIVVVLVAIGAGVYWYSKNNSDNVIDSKLFSPPKRSPLQEATTAPNPLIERLKNLDISLK